MVEVWKQCGRKIKYINGSSGSDTQYKLLEEKKIMKEGTEIK
jgi:hypothetical protein